MKTGVEISFGLFDTTAKVDSTPACAAAQPFVGLPDLKLAEVPIHPRLATLEADFFRLDGSYQLFPDDPAALPFWGLWSREMSGADGRFFVLPQLTVTFTQPHSCLGLTMEFDPLTGDYAGSVEVAWYDRQSRVISRKPFSPLGAICFLENNVEDFYRLEITFLATAKPYRYLKLSAISYGLEMHLGPEDMISANILERMDPTSAELAVNTLDFQLHSKSDDFSPLNPKGVFAFLQRRQELSVTEKTPAGPVAMGIYYLDSWESGGKNSVKMSAVDPVGILSGTTFAGGIYDSIPAGELVAAMMRSAGVQYELEASLAAVPLSGYLSLCTHRKALQQVAFALGAVADCSRSDRIKIFPPPPRPSSFIDYDRKFSGEVIKLRPLVTGVNVTAHRYLPDSEPKELFSDRLDPGEYEITFDAPAHTLAVTGGSIQAGTVNQAKIRVTSAGPVTVTGRGYTDAKRVVSKRMQNLPANAAANIVTVEEATLVSAANAAAVADRLYDYYQQRYESQAELLMGRERNGDTVILRSLRDEKLRGVVESLDIDLTGGFRAKIKVVGVRIETISGSCVGELYAGEKVGVM